MKEIDDSVSIELGTKVNMDAIKNLDINEIKTLLPNNTGKIILENVVEELKGHNRWDDYYEIGHGLFEYLGKDPEISFGKGVENILIENDLEKLTILLDMNIFEFLTPDESESILKSVDIEKLMDFFLILDKYNFLHDGSLSEDDYGDRREMYLFYLENLSKLIANVKGKLPKSLEDQFQKKFEESPSDFCKVYPLIINILDFNLDFWEKLKILIIKHKEFSCVQKLIPDLLQHLNKLNPEDRIKFISNFEQKKITNLLIQSAIDKEDMDYHGGDLINFWIEYLSNLGQLGVKILIELFKTAPKWSETLYIIEDIDYIFREFRSSFEKLIASNIELKELISIEVMKLFNDDEIIGSFNECLLVNFLSFVKTEERKKILANPSTYIKRLRMLFKDFDYDWDYLHILIEGIENKEIESFLVNVLTKELDWELYDYFLEKFFSIFNKNQIRGIFENDEYNLLERLVQNYSDNNSHLDHFVNCARLHHFFNCAYKKRLDREILLKIYNVLPSDIQTMIINELEDSRKNWIVDFFYFSKYPDKKNQYLKPYFCLTCGKTHDGGKMWFDHRDRAYREGDTRGSYI